MMFEMHPATDYTTDQLHMAMLDAFSDYSIPMKLSQPEFEAMMRQRGLDLASSRVAIVENVIAGIWLTSVRDDRAYLISSGTRKAYRSQGIARAMAEDCLASLRNTGVRTFQTEVLRDNATALNLYTSLGLIERRLFDCYRIPASQTFSPSSLKIQQVKWSNIYPQVAELRDWEPSWQNDDQSLLVIAENLRCFAIFEGADLSAFVAFTFDTGTVHQLAVRKSLRRRGIGMAMLKAVQLTLPGSKLRFINVAQTDLNFRALMESMKAEETLGQYELLLHL